MLISSFRLHPLADLTRLWEALHAGKVRIGIRTIDKPDDGQFMVEIADNGPGLETEMLKRALDVNPFDGHGQPRTGLALTRAIAEQHGGHLKILSKPGAGTLVRIILPKRYDPMDNRRQRGQRG